MPRRSLFTTAQLEALLAFPTTEIEIARYYTFDDRDLSIIRQRRGDHNRLGFAIQLCCLRYPGYAITSDLTPPDKLINYVAQQLRIKPASWHDYGQRDETRREHALELQTIFGYIPFTAKEYRQHRGTLIELALQTKKAEVIAQYLIELLRKNRFILPPPLVIDRLCNEILVRGTQLFHQRLVLGLTSEHRKRLNKLLTQYGV